MKKFDQSLTPLASALEAVRENRIVPFDVPGHKRGRGNKELTDFLGKQCVGIDVNSMKPLDNLCHPVSVIKDAEKLTAEAFGAEAAFFMVGGTTSAVQAMILSCVRPGEKIILPRNAHRSAFNALVLSGAVPVYITPTAEPKTGILSGLSVESAVKAMDENPQAKAIFINNPTYYGVCSDIAAITAEAHKRGIMVLADEAHGTHFYFGDNLPVSAMAAGADMSAVSMHKSGGSLTQSSILLLNKGIDAQNVSSFINLTQTTSGSYILMSSLDISRKRLAQNGREIFAKVAEMTEYARGEINSSGGYYAYSKELTDGKAFYDFDITKLAVSTADTGLTGHKIYDLLIDEYDIQAEFGDRDNILAYVSVGDNYKHIERLISALGEIYSDYGAQPRKPYTADFFNGEIKLSPRQAFYADREKIPFLKSAGRISAQSVMCYPPGIPAVTPGEIITQNTLEYLKAAKRMNAAVIGTDDELLFIDVVKE